MNEKESIDVRGIKDIKVSLIVAIYNSAPFMEKLMISILNQSHKNIEIILVDDGSSDNSGLLCDYYAKNDDRVKVIHKQNGGACEARNYGMKIMTGEYFSVIDGDDWLSNDYVEYLLSLAVNNNADMSLTDSVFTTRDLKQNLVEMIEFWTPEYMAEYIVYPKMIIGPWNKLYKTSFILEHNIQYDVPMSGETPYFVTKVANNNPIIIKGHKKVYYYRMNNISSALTSNAVIYGKNALWNIKNVKKITNIRTKRFQNVIDWHIYNNYHFLLKLIVSTKSYKKYWKELLSCLLMIRISFIRILFIMRKDFSKSAMFSLLKQAILPIRYAKKKISIEQNLLVEDLNNSSDI